MLWPWKLSKNSLIRELASFNCLRWIHSLILFVEARFPIAWYWVYCCRIMVELCSIVPVTQQCQVYWLWALRRLARVFVRVSFDDFFILWWFFEAGGLQALKRAVCATGQKQDRSLWFDELRFAISLSQVIASSLVQVFEEGTTWKYSSSFPFYGYENIICLWWWLSNTVYSSDCVLKKSCLLDCSACFTG